MSLVLFLTRRVLAIAVLAWAVTLAAFALLRIGLKSPAMSAQISAQLGADRPALKSGDLMVIMGAALLTGLLISVVSLIVNVCQALLDPRVHIA
jgi:ABC-type dipeptide/oligopeptide/nickel transport system permease component